MNPAPASSKTKSSSLVIWLVCGFLGASLLVIAFVAIVKTPSGRVSYSVESPAEPTPPPTKEPWRPSKTQTATLFVIGLLLAWYLRNDLIAYGKKAVGDFLNKLLKHSGVVVDM